MTKVLVKFRLDDAEVAQLDELAALESRSRSNLVAFVVSEWIADQLHLSEQPAERSPEIVTSGPEAGKSRPRKRGGAPAIRVDRVSEVRPGEQLVTQSGKVLSGEEIERYAREAVADAPQSPMRPRKRDSAPAAPVDTPAAGPPAGPTNAPASRGPAKPHRHRYVTEVPGSRQGRAGVIQADYACACGEVKRQAVR